MGERAVPLADVPRQHNNGGKTGHPRRPVPAATPGNRPWSQRDHPLGDDRTHCRSRKEQEQVSEVYAQACVAPGNRSVAI